MPVITNTWVEKERKKRMHETAPAYDFEHDDSYSISSTEKKSRRHNHAARGMYSKTLRGVRK